MTACVRGCTIPKRHYAPCPVDNYHVEAWVAADLQPDDRDQLMDGDVWLQHGCARGRWYIGTYGGLEEHRACNGCQPREATNGLVCEQCHIRLAGWVSDKTSLAWAYFWLGKNLQPGQTSAARQEVAVGTSGLRASRQRGSGNASPAGIAITVYDLRQEVAEEIARYLARLCNEYHLHGPDWFRNRVTAARRRPYDEDDADWRAWLPQTQAEVASACSYFTAWLDRIEGDVELVIPMYEAFDQVMRQTEAVAPWRRPAKKLPGIRCPRCEHKALVIDDGDSHVTCRRCNELISQERYAIWTQMGLHDRATKAAS